MIYIYVLCDHVIKVVLLFFWTIYTMEINLVSKWLELQYVGPPLKVTLSTLITLITHVIFTLMITLITLLTLLE